MSTRTTGKRETLEGRCEARIQASWKRKGVKVSVTPYFAALPVSHVRAELQRVARQVRKLERPIDTAGDMVHNAALRKVQALIRKATR